MGSLQITFHSRSKFNQLMILLDFYLYVYSHCLFSLQRIDIHTQANKKKKRKAKDIYIFIQNEQQSLSRKNREYNRIYCFFKIVSNLFCLCVSAQDNNET